jgi:hypothetical protein
MEDILVDFIYSLYRYTCKDESHSLVAFLIWWLCLFVNSSRVGTVAPHSRMARRKISTLGAVYAKMGLSNISNIIVIM